MRTRKPDTRKGDRHSPGYMAKYLREYRAKRKASSPKPIPQNTIEKEEK